MSTQSTQNTQPIDPNEVKMAVAIDHIDRRIDVLRTEHKSALTIAELQKVKEILNGMK